MHPLGFWCVENPIRVEVHIFQRVFRVFRVLRILRGYRMFAAGGQSEAGVSRQIAVLVSWQAVIVAL